jgi:transcription initiation factor TFIID subunit 5
MEGKVIVWDLSNGTMLSVLAKHDGPVYSLSFSREGNMLATAGRDCAVRLWNFAGMTEDIAAEEGGSGTATLTKESSKLNGAEYFICEFLSKQVPAYSLHFTRRNILLVSGPFNH